MKIKFTESEHCTSHVHCRACRTDEKFRASLMQAFDWDGECPHGYTIDSLLSAKRPDPQPLPVSVFEETPFEQEAQSEPELPPLKNQAQNLIKALVKAGTAAVTGEQLKVDKAVYAERLAICQKCALYIRSKKRCAHIQCGCFVEAKAWLATEECPAEFWKNPEKQQAFNEEHIASLRKMQRNVLFIDDFLKAKDALLNCGLSEKSQLRAVFKELDSNKGGCTGCRRGKFTTKFSKALLKDLESSSEAVRKALRGILGHREYIINDNVPLTWDQAMEKADGR